jgi:hypothetical protein
MPRDSGRDLDRSLTLRDWIFYLVLLLCLLAGLALIATSVFWRGEADKLLGPDVVRDLGIALLVSVFMTFAIELYASKRVRQELTYHALSAAYQQIVPEKIFDQINDNVFSSGVYRRNWEVRIQDLEYPSGSGDTAVIIARYYYQVENLRKRRISYTILASVDLDDPPPSGDLSVFKTFNVNDMHDGALVKEADIKRLIDKSPKQLQHLVTDKRLEKAVINKGNATLECVGQNMNLAVDIKIPAESFVSVSFSVQREIRVPGNYVLSSPVPADGIKIRINVEKFKLYAVPLHPNGREGLRQISDDTWQFDAGILPWQGFRFVSESVDLPGSSPTATSTAQAGRI